MSYNFEVIEKQNKTISNKSSDNNKINHHKNEIEWKLHSVLAQQTKSYLGNSI